jgi:hypothetical protein
MGDSRLKTLRLDSLENDPLLKEWLVSGLVGGGGLYCEGIDSLLGDNATLTFGLPPGEQWPEGTVRPESECRTRVCDSPLCSRPLSRVGAKREGCGCIRSVFSWRVAAWVCLPPRLKTTCAAAAWI